MKWVRHLVLATVALACAVLGVRYFLGKATNLQRMEIATDGKTIQIEGHYNATARRVLNGGTRVIIGNHIIAVTNDMLRVNDDEHAIADMAGARIFIAKSGAISVEILP